MTAARNLIVLVLLTVFIVARVRASIARGASVAAGHRKCFACHARLARDGMHGYATTCRRCGRVQPWAGRGAI